MESEANENIKIFPNPVSERLNILSNEKSFQKIIIFDISGKKVIEKSFLTETNQSEISTETLPSGQYFLRLEGDSRFQKTILFQKN